MTLPDKFNAASYFVDRHVKEGRGEKVAIECGDGRVTYRELFSNVNRVGNGLLKLGIRREERVILILPDIPEFAFGFFGAIKIGAVPVPLNPRLTPADYEYLINDSQAQAAIVGESPFQKLKTIPKDRLGNLKHIIVVGSEKIGRNILFNDFMAQCSPELEPAPTGKDDVAFWLYSSGSTGAPKACVHLQHDMVVCSENYAKGILNITDRDRCFSASKLFFAYGLGNALYYPFSVGATSILMPEPPKPENVFNAIERHKPTLFFSVPSNYASLLSHKGETHDNFDLSSIRLCISAGEALPAAFFHRLKERFGIEILDGIGSTEALQTFISNIPDHVRPGSSGQIVPGYEAKIVDDDNMPVRRGEVGNLLIKSDATCAYYWNQPEKSKLTIEGEWLRTGDKYFEDEDGFFWYVGRTDDMIKSSGAWVSSVEVENVLMDHPAVFEVAVIGRVDSGGLTKPMACVVLRDGLLGTPEVASELQKLAASRLPNYKRPRWVEFLTKLPKTATGKIQRFKLRASKNFSTS